MFHNLQSYLSVRSYSKVDYLGDRILLVLTPVQIVKLYRKGFTSSDHLNEFLILEIHTYI